MEIQVAQPEKLVGKLTTAGAVLVGENTPTVLGDFTAGPSHTLPTGRTGRFSGGLQVVDFMRRSSYVKYDKKSLAKAKDVVVAFGKMESLDAHYKSLLERI
jgi:histidinol dehydrogenase